MKKMTQIEDTWIPHPVVIYISLILPKCLALYKYELHYV